ncbi:replication protein [Paraburkholderia graminis]|uniref:replication protein n=1 Tax=Paraburkholderia graminis TaxID=60548 RepID=UPI0038B9083F
MQEASPQLENGYTRLANELLDALINAGLTARQWAVVMAVIRKTYGFNKKADEIGLSQLSLMTGIDKAHLSRTVRELEAAKVIHREAGVHGHSLSINKRHKDWGLLKEQPQLPKKQPLLNEQPGGCQNSNVGVAESATLGLLNEQPQYTSLKTNQKTTSKDTIPHSLRERFDTFWAAYPRKTEKQDALKAFVKLNPDADLFEQILRGLEISKKSEQWQNKRFIKHAATWLNKACWTDEVSVEFTPSQIDVIAAYNDALGGALGEIDPDLFSEERAGAIDAFLTFHSKDPDFWKRYFPWVAANVDVPPHCGMDYLISRDGFTKVKGGQFMKDKQ